MSNNSLSVRISALLESMSAPQNSAQWLTSMLLAHRPIPVKDLMAHGLSTVKERGFLGWAQKAPDRPLSSRQASVFGAVMDLEEHHIINSTTQALASMGKWAVLESLVKKTAHPYVAHIVMELAQEFPQCPDTARQSILRTGISVICSDFNRTMDPQAIQTQPDLKNPSWSTYDIGPHRYVVDGQTSRHSMALSMWGYRKFDLALTALPRHIHHLYGQNPPQSKVKEALSTTYETLSRLLQSGLLDYDQSEEQHNQAIGVFEEIKPILHRARLLDLARPLPPSVERGKPAPKM